MRHMRGWKNKLGGWWLMALVLSPSLSSADATSGEPMQLRVGLSTEWRQLAGGGAGPSKVEQALVSVVLPPGFDAAREWPVLIVNATSDRGYNSSRALMQAYRAAAGAAGWVSVAADPEPAVSPDEDLLQLRYVLAHAALAAVKPMWKGADQPRIAFAGFSGGAKYSGWLAALFRSRGVQVAGVYMAGVNTNALGEAAKQFGVLDDVTRAVPVFLQGGTKDKVATPAQHRDIEDDLRVAGFTRVRLELVPGDHVVNASPLQQALAWFAQPVPQAVAASAPAR
jgi:predicted esterase